MPNMKNKRTAVNGGAIYGRRYARSFRGESAWSISTTTFRFNQGRAEVSEKPVCPALLLADKIELHLKLDETPGYYLTKEDQEIIIDSLRFTSRYQDDPSTYVKGVHDADAMVGALW